MLTVWSVQMSVDAKKHLHSRKARDVMKLGGVSVDGFKKHLTPYMRSCALALAPMRALGPMLGAGGRFRGASTRLAQAKWKT
jgi:hypothetical protein